MNSSTCRDGPRTRCDPGKPGGCLAGGRPKNPPTPDAGSLALVYGSNAYEGPARRAAASVAEMAATLSAGVWRTGRASARCAACPRRTGRTERPRDSSRSPTWRGRRRARAPSRARHQDDDVRRLAEHRDVLVQDRAGRHVLDDDGVPGLRVLVGCRGCRSVTNAELLERHTGRPRSHLDDRRRRCAARRLLRGARHDRTWPQAARRQSSCRRRRVQ